MSFSATRSSTARRLAIVVRGVVQGVGFRPFVYNLAQSQRLAGWVVNQSDTVQIEVQGSPAALAAFVDTLHHSPPPQARIADVEVREIGCQEDDAPFEIRASIAQAAPQPTIPADLATCGDCQAEIRAHTERRWRYAFTNCTNCGPRWSIITSLPYDRPRTAMARFPMCPDCEAEYHNPADRRFHAQPIACPACGPSLQLLDPAGNELALGDAALSQAAEALRHGQIVAMKGLGGFQLLVDATQDEAVARLRHRKRRPDKPLAVMLRTPDDVRRHCRLSDEEAQILQSPSAPILLLGRQPQADADVGIAESVAPGNPYLGVMLPYTPLHHLLIDALDRPIVCSSGNVSEEPMCIDTEDALQRLNTIADVFLTHDRPIVRPVDDSVAQIGAEGMQLLRRARGFAPMPIALRGETVSQGERGASAPCFLGPPPTTLESSESHGASEAIREHRNQQPAHAGHSPLNILAVGGHLKNTVALALGPQVVLSPHVGDLDNVLSVDVHRRAVGDLLDFFQASIDAVACDLHPDYASTRTAEMLSHQHRVPLVRVQHHHAHVAACMAEHGIDGPVLGFAWDGTGYGTDGTVWGGEMLVCQAADFTRVGHLRTFPLPGGDRAMREPRRSALGLLFAMDPELAARETAPWFRPDERKTLLAVLERGVLAPRTSSMGRLFDAVAALCGWPAAMSFEGQAAMALQFAAEEGHADAYPWALTTETPAIADWEPLVRAVLADREAGVPVGRISARFHNALAAMAVQVADRSDVGLVALSGGCFHNILLTERVSRALRKAGFTVYVHHQVPAGDGGIALGQVSVAARRLRG